MFLNFFLVPSSFVFFQRFLGSSCTHAHFFLLVGLISGPESVGTSPAGCSMSRISLHVESSRKSGLRSLSKISWETLSVTSRHQIYISLPRRDVDLHVATSFFTPLCHVATWMYTSRRQLVQVPVTSRRGFTRRDVVWSCALSRRDVTPNVATWSCLLSVTSRRHPARRDVALFLAKNGSFWPFISHTLTHRNPSTPAYHCPPDPSELPSHGSAAIHCSPTIGVHL